MHFAILESEDLLDAYGSSYTSYKLQCNGTFHGSGRYREFFNLHEALRAEFSNLPTFPPKKLFNLSVFEVNSRRQQLEKYMQNLGQVADILSSSILHSFLQRIQLRSVEDATFESLQVFLLNGSPVALSDLSPRSSCLEVLECVSRELKLPSELTYYFALFLAKEEQGRFSVFKKLAPFEIPFAVARLNSTENHPLRLVFKKSFWDPAFDNDILDNSSRVGINVLFVETVDAINRGWMAPTPDQKLQLEALQKKGSRREFVQLARAVKSYGSVYFGACTMDYPSYGTPTRPYLTARDLVCPLKVSASTPQEAVFRVIRMRCWKLCVSDTYKSGHSADAPQSRTSLMFEYLLGRDKLQWITIYSEEAIWMSACLQTVVEELVQQKRGVKFQKPPTSKNRNKSGENSESLQVSVTVTRKMTNDNSAFEEIGDDDL